MKRLFDLNGDGSIDFNELQYSINLFKEYKIEDRVNGITCYQIIVFVDLCDENDDGYFDSEDLKKFFHRNLNNEEEILDLKINYCLSNKQEDKLSAEHFITTIF